MTKDQKRLTNILGIAGLVSIAIGCGALSLPWSFIVVGSILLAMSIVGARLQ